MRILYVTHSFPAPGRPLSNIGGMQRVAVDLQRGLAAHPEIELTTLALETSWRWTGVRTPPFLLSLLRRIPRIVRERRIEAVLFSSMVTASVAPLIRARVREAGAVLAAVPVGRDVTLPGIAYQRFVPNVLRALDAVLPISRATAEACLARGTAAEAVTVVPCGVDLPALVPAADRTAARAEVLRLAREAGADAPDDALLLLSVGRHQERKGFHWFAGEVMPRLPERAVYVVGGSGPTTARIAEAASSGGVSRRVALLGQVSEEILVELYRGSDLFVMPNIPVAGDIEGFGVVMLEANAAGLPVVAADLEGIRDVVTPGENGALAPPLDATAFAASIAAYADPDARRDAGAAAAKHVRARFAWPTIADAHLRALRAARAGSEEAEEARAPAQTG